MGGLNAVWSINAERNDLAEEYLCSKFVSSVAAYQPIH